MKGLRWPVVAACVVLAVAGVFLTCWFSGDPDLVRFAAWRCKTNTCIGLALGGASLLLLDSGRRRLAYMTATTMLLIGSATMFEYGSAIEVIAYVALFGAIVLVLARSLDTTDALRTETEHELRMAGELTAGLARADSVEEVARTVIELGLPALGACAGSIYLLQPDHGQLCQLAIQGYTPEQQRQYATMDISAATPITDAARTTELVILATRDELVRRYPHLGEPTQGVRSWAAVPLEGRERVIGVMGLSFRARELQPEAVGRIQHLALQCGQALDRALLFEEVKHARDVARDANRAKDSFLAVLGHELRNPLAPITHALELMRDRDPSSSRERAVIERQVQKVSRLVDDLLDVSRIAKGNVELTRENVEIADVARDAVEHVRPILDERRPRLSTSLDPNLYVDGDRARLVQVISNLLHNAARYTAPGGEIRLATVRTGGEVVITVADNGVGIDPALMPSLFEPFVQGERRLERAAGGLGLGLSIVRDLVVLHGGAVDAHSDGEGRGATFTVRLPAVARARSSATSLRQAPQQPREARRVLIVDDNEDAAELMAESLSNAGHATRVAFDGERALEVVNEFDPEYVILDIGLPRIDGYEVARRLRASDAEHRRRRVLVALTGFGQAEDVQRALDAGFDRHLVKPMPVKVALEIIASLPSPATGTAASPAWSGHFKGEPNAG